MVTITIMSTVLTHNRLCPLYDYHHGYCAHTQRVVSPVRLPSWLLCLNTTHCVLSTITIMATVLTQYTLCPLYHYHHGYCAHTQHAVSPVRLPSWLLCSHTSCCVPCTITIMATVLSHNTLCPCAITIMATVLTHNGLCRLYDYHYC